MNRTPILTVVLIAVSFAQLALSVIVLLSIDDVKLYMDGVRDQIARSRQMSRYTSCIDVDHNYVVCKKNK